MNLDDKKASCVLVLTTVGAVGTAVCGSPTASVFGGIGLANHAADAVRKQDVREFHTMINNFAAKHLVAIQVLGYALGLLVGLVQLAG